MSKNIIEPGSVLSDGLPLGTIITDERIQETYQRLFANRHPICVPNGENGKSLDAYENLMTEMARCQCSNIVAVGGGAVGDLVGLAASTFRRGIPVIHVPTTTTAMLDSSIGGKNGINVLNFKNYIGTFHFPEHVIVDPMFLSTVSDKTLWDGLVEAVKTWVLFGKPEIDDILKFNPNDEHGCGELIKQCRKYKWKLVKRDPYDRGVRRSLNFGHTIGHAIELVLGFNHGRAVAAGMVAESMLAEAQKVGTKRTALLMRAGTMATTRVLNDDSAKLRGLLNRCGFHSDDLKLIFDNRKEILHCMCRDKKNDLSANEIRFAFGTRNHMCFSVGEVNEFLKRL